MGKEKYSQYQIQELENWEAYLNSNTEQLKHAFYKIIFHHDFENNLNLSNSEKIGKIEFWHNADELDFWTEFLNYDEYPIEKLNDKKLLFSKYDDFSGAWNFDFEYPKDMDVYYEEYRNSKFSYEKDIKFFTWFAKCWSDCGGQDIGILTTTDENSVRRIFNLIYMNWDSSIDAPNQEEGQRYDSPLNRKLTEFEIASRVSFTRLSKFKMYWRYFEKGNSFYEFGIYNWEVFFRKGAISDEPNLSFNSAPYKKEVLKRMDALINNGFYEKPRPHTFSKISPHFVEWDFGIRIKEEPFSEEGEFHKLEQKFNLTIPGSYKWFIKRMNNPKSMSRETHFSVGFEDWHRIERFYSVNELFSVTELIKLEVELPNSFIPIAVSETSLTVLLDCENEKVYCLDNETEVRQIAESFQDFLDKCLSISSYFCPRGYHIEYGNISTVKSWFDEGWDMKDLKTTRSILGLSYKDEMNLLLLKNGADPNSAILYSDLISREYLLALIEHGMDFQKKLDESKWLRKNLEKRGEFEDILMRYK